jgi:four helix bundle protein
MGQTYRQLIAWQKAMDLVDLVYDCTDQFPRRELYDLGSQLRRAAVSVPSNIAEGQARQSQREFYRFLSNARGSLAEIETQVLIAQRRHYISAADAERVLDRCAELGRILNGLIASIKRRCQVVSEN